MAGEMDWSPNYCLNCDKQTSEPHYCSQSCRLADLQRSSYSKTVAPSYAYSSSLSSPTSASSTPYSSLSFSVNTPTRSNVQVQLPPAFNFAAFRSGGAFAASSYSPPSSPRSQRQSYSSTTRQYTTSHPSPPALQRSHTEHYGSSSSTRRQQGTLYNSTSRSSLSSVASSSTSGVSDQALSELQKYSNAFDHMRDYKRRVTLS